MGASAELLSVFAVGAAFLILHDAFVSRRQAWSASEYQPWTTPAVRLDRSFAFVKSPDFIFTFGDSYTTEDWPWYWDANPLEPYEPHTAADGPVWARNLTSIYPNPAKLVNLACGGATVDNDVAHHWNPPLDFKAQVSAFQRWLTPPPKRAQWHSYNSIFAIEFGTNDVIITFRGTERMRRLNQTQDDLRKDIMWRYFDHVERLYDLGARAFAFQLLVPFDRARIGIDLGAELQSDLREAIAKYNEALRLAAHSYCAYKYEQTNGDIFCSITDLYTLASDIMDNPETFGFKEATDYCPAYAPRSNAEPDMDVDPSCIGPVGDYVWKDTLHPSWTFHQYWAQHFYLQVIADLTKLHK